jgi:preprotein translocase subunit SecE
MAVAVKTNPDQATRPEAGSLLGSCVLGAAYVLAGLAVLMFGIPRLWETGVSTWLRPALGSFVDFAGLIVVQVFAVALLGVLGQTLAGGTPRPGLKAGVFSLVSGLAVLAVVATAFAGGGTFAEVTGLALIGVGAFFGVRFCVGQRFDPVMRDFDAQGWFSFESYKPAQGRIVRRATLIGLLGIVACGIITLINHRTLGAAGNDWVLKLPLIGSVGTLVPNARTTLPVVLSLAAFWFAWRLVNMPTFAEFLIATEGELNKIAWPTRKSLIQDTIVVLVTVVFMTIFLFVVDVAWGKILSHPWVGVLRLESGEPAQVTKDVKDLDW